MPAAANEALVARIMANKSDYYAVLEVARTAEEKEIRRSYHKLSLRLHPDKNLGNKQCEEAYRVVNHCYEVLMDRTKRNIYDLYGEKDMDKFMRFEEDMLPLRDFLKFLVTLFAYSVVRRAATRSSCAELADEVFPEMAAARSSAAGADGIHFPQEHHDWSRLHAVPKRRTRQRLRGFIVVASVLLFLVAGVNRFVYRFLPVGPDPVDGAAASGPSLSEEERTRKLQDDLLFPPKRSGGKSKAQSKSAVAATTFTVYESCLSLGNPTEVVRCNHAKVQERADSTSSDNGGQERTFGVTRYGGTDEDGLVAFHSLLREECAQEALLAEASRQRFEPTSSLKLRGPPPARKSPTRTSSRKYPERRWRPKFSQSYTVARHEDLFQPRPICSKLKKL